MEPSKEKLQHGFVPRCASCGNNQGVALQQWNQGVAKTKKHMVLYRFDSWRCFFAGGTSLKARGGPDHIPVVADRLAGCFAISASLRSTPQPGPSGNCITPFLMTGTVVTI